MKFFVPDVYLYESYLFPNRWTLIIYMVVSKMKWSWKNKYEELYVPINGQILGHLCCKIIKWCTNWFLFILFSVLQLQSSKLQFFSNHICFSDAFFSLLYLLVFTNFCLVSKLCLFDNDIWIHEIFNEFWTYNVMWLFRWTFHFLSV